jgi:hypothetical protein
MQISGVSLTLTWPLRLCLLRVLLGTTATATSFPLSKHTRGGDTAPAFLGLRVYLQFMWEVGLPPSPVEFSSHCHFYKLSRSWLLGMCHHSCLFWLACLFTAHMGSGPSPLSCGVFLLLPTFTSFPGPHCWVGCWVGAAASAFSGGLFTYSSVRDCPSPPSVLRVPCPLCYVPFLLLLLIIQFFFFFPWVGVSLSGGYADLTQGCLWEYCVPLSSPCGPHLS